MQKEGSFGLLGIRPTAVRSVRKSWLPRLPEAAAARLAWQLLASTRGRPALGECVMLTDRDGADAVAIRLVDRADGGTWLALPEVAEPFTTLLARVGRVPLPGYIRGGAEQEGDLERYQTVFAREAGAAAAPTAGLHFTPELLGKLDVERVTLHVGLDTFRPLAVDELGDFLISLGVERIDGAGVAQIPQLGKRPLTGP